MLNRGLQKYEAISLLSTTQQSGSNSECFETPKLSIAHKESTVKSATSLVSG